MDCTDMHSACYMTIIVLNLIVEAWLGRTDKVKSGSILELGLNIAKTVLSSIIKFGKFNDHK